jgi:hypothetical protein
MAGVIRSDTRYRALLVVDTNENLQVVGNQVNNYVWDPVGLVWVRETQPGSGKTLVSTSFSLSATGTVVAAVVGRRIKVYAVKLIVSASANVNWRDGGATNMEGAQAIAANGGYVETVQPPAFLFGTTAGNTLDLVVSGGGTAAGRVSYWTDDAT